MKIWIDTSFVLKNKIGIGNYVLLLFKLFDNLNIKYSTISCDFLENKSFKAIFYMLWLNTVFFIITLIKKPDIIIFPSFIMPYLKRNKTKYITVIHDLIPYCSPKSLSKYSLFINKLAINIAVRKADKILTVSETVKNEILEKFKLHENQINVIYSHFPDSFYTNLINEESILRQYSLQRNTYILSVACFAKRKNINSLIKAFDIISNKYPHIKLVLVGKADNDKISSKNKNIIFTGYIKDEEVPIFYKNALMYIFPSFYEGMGLPVLEAQYFKTPLICSNIPVFNEIAGEGALFCENQPDQLALKIELLINDENMRKVLIEKGYKNVQRFDFEIIEKQLSTTLKELGYIS